MLKKTRQSKSMAQKEIAAFLGVTQTAVSDWESGKRKPDYETLVKLANFFNTSTDYLLGLTDDPTPPGTEPVAPVVFARDEFEGLNPDEVDILASIAKTLKEQRLSKNNK